MTDPLPPVAGPPKSHFVLLDGLRGVASLMVVAFHLFEAYAANDPQKQIINHGYMAVDFFFLLSGFVLAYAYDDRWDRLSVGGFFLRRVVRLQPMVVVGSLFGAALFAFQHYSIYPKAGTATPAYVLLVMLLGCLMIPLPKSADLRGWDEIYPLNGPAWSLFYEYVANALYALGLRRLPNGALALLVALFGAALVHLLVWGPRGDVIGGWALDSTGIRIGLSRVLFPFFAGVLLMRIGGRIRVPHSFAVSSALLVLALALPRMGGPERLWVNGLYESACIILLFPVIVAIGAGEQAVDGPSIRLARFFGRLSYPLYITHYPLIYIFTGWVVDRKIPPAQGALVGVATFVAALLFAYACLKLYDEPARRWLAARLLPRRG
ncbi:acyltransferase family protein [Sphingomonas morindae]|uniref:Acyltransferase n=1 Tax=Sphingomonas morindae TaxID=1541170 RepID=A0ABY4X780_9SPHN|nr:acyltransferase [Sphingomonas morindae]USI72766.1 acyltransferase [Sphingomonas morindae]